MNFNFIPTDNLYKFIAVAGIFLIVLNIFFVGEEDFKLVEENIIATQFVKNTMEGRLNHLRLKNDSGTFELKIASELQKNREKYFAQIEILLKQREKTEDIEQFNKLGNKIDFLFKECEKSMKQAKVLLDRNDLREKRDKRFNWEYDSIQTIINDRQQLLDVKIKRHDYYRAILWIGYVLGSLMTTFGMYQWMRYQQVQDQIQFKRIPIEKKIRYGKLKSFRWKYLREKK